MNSDKVKYTKQLKHSLIIKKVEMKLAFEITLRNPIHMNNSVLATISTRNSRF